MLFRYGDWHASGQHWTNVGRQLGIEHRHVEDSDVTAIRDTLPFGPPNPAHVLDLSPELVLSQLGFSIYLRKRTIGLSCLVGSVVGGGGSDGQGQVRSAAGGGTTGRTPASDSGWETSGPSHRQGPDSPQERRRLAGSPKWLKLWMWPWAQCTGSSSALPKEGWPGC